MKLKFRASAREQLAFIRLLLLLLLLLASLDRSGEQTATFNGPNGYSCSAGGLPKQRGFCGLRGRPLAVVASRKRKQNNTCRLPGRTSELASRLLKPTARARPDGHKENNR